MKVFAEAIVAGFVLGVFFALGAMTEEWLAARFLGWRKPAEHSQALTIHVDNKQALAALDELQARVKSVSERIRDVASGVV